MATRSRGRFILSPWTSGSLSGSLTCPCTTHTRKGFTRSRSPFPVEDKEENINKHTPTISRSLIKITNTHLTPNLNPRSSSGQRKSRVHSHGPLNWSSAWFNSFLGGQLPQVSTAGPSVAQGQKSIDHLQPKHNIPYTSKTFHCNFLESSFPSSVWIDLPIDYV